ncbi:Glycosyl transferase family 2 [Pseudoalteromonas sp. P1-26]|uniref:glycosyltransferase family 2 protein n=1 Tax=Pseudoalteromonas sp. P1-26 TaxID=1723759 RepID=UPI0006D663CC|nr:glycosyltransferase family A protein [Pseudoalteromonas sp. P1-26]KPZ67176.1 Glycosyl transferase family 2 [Pseudoalteromonas sp. P1-26]
MNKVALILCTLGRTEEVIAALDSINTNIENDLLCDLIIVDQNKDDILKNKVLALKFYENINILYCKVDFCGLSRARNYGMKMLPLRLSEYDIVSFPDDDCVYSKLLLRGVADFFNSNKNIDFVSTQTKDFITGDSLIPVYENYHQIIKNNIRGCSFTFFFRGRCFENGVNFDEVLGVGSGTRYGSAEEEDLILKLLDLNLFGLSIPKIFVYHPAKESKLTIDTLRRNYSYSGGKVYCLFKNKQLFTKKEFVLQLLKPAVKPFYSILSPSKALISMVYAIGFYISLFSLAIYNEK